MGYKRPGDYPISSTWADHKNRNPPSSEPGTDYASAYGSPIYCADAGYVSDRKTDNGSATGRFVTVELLDGRTVRYLHLSSIQVSVGQRVNRGQRIATSGASGYGNDWYYGAHVHVTLWPGHIWDNPTIDFAKYVGEEEPEPKPEEEEMVRALKGGYYKRGSDGAQVVLLWNESDRFWTEYSTKDGGYNNEIAESWETGPFAPISESHAGAIKRDLDKRNLSDEIKNYSVASFSVAGVIAVIAYIISVTVH